MRISDWSSDVCSSDLAEARALVLAVQRAVDLPELAQGRRNVLARHADAVVAHLEDVAVLGAAVDAEADPAAGGGELDGVDKQVQQRLLQLALVDRKSTRLNSSH